jgi:asparagine synthase (glutamine-hydrolysing)
MDRYGSGLKLNAQERYWQWATFMNTNEVVDRLSNDALEKLDFDEAESRRKKLTHHLEGSRDFNDVLYTDMQLVLPNDMLVKVDMMSMANGLEVRSPFLDYRLVEYVFQLPVDSKVNRNMRKRILQDTFRDILPPQLYRRPKKGFEVPLLKWFRKELKPLIFNDLLNDEFIKSQNIFNVDSIEKIKKKLFSLNPGDVHAQLWALIVFQWWWKKYFR